LAKGTVSMKNATALLTALLCVCLNSYAAPETGVPEKTAKSMLITSILKSTKSEKTLVINDE
jgi:hypothetical protein